MGGLTKFRQQHRRTVDGRLCAAAFVQHRQAFTDCTDAPNPDGVSGQPWCYVESQLQPGSASWGVCAPLADYGAAREEAARALRAKAQEAKRFATKLAKAQAAAEKALDMYHSSCR